LPCAFRDDLFAGRVALVTGGAGGIGRAICILLGRLGASIVTCGRDQAKLDQLAKSLEELGIRCQTVQANIRDPEQVAQLLASAHDQQGGVDLVVNNAGGQFPLPAVDISPKGWAAVVETNLYGTWYVMQAAAREWIARKQTGSIVNIGTIIGRGSVGIPHTAAARAGAQNLAASLSVEWAPHQIRINTVAVGVVRSPGLLHYPPEARPSFDHNPQRRLGDVHDVAQAVAFLGSPEASGFVTGEVTHVAGGGQLWGEYWALGKPDWFKVAE
jgi:citronellol/citronellal dehydrogenase